ncbi:MAG: OmpA family protein, partial [Spirochaetales bacterium]
AETDTYVVRFNPDSANLRPDTRQRLSEIADAVVDDDFLLRIDGHTAIAGTSEGRRRLSQLRAERVRDYLVDAGVSAERITGLRALAATQPLTDDPQRQDANRRVEIVEIQEEKR